MNRNVISSGKYILKVYDKLSEKISSKYGLTTFELRVLFFLKCNPTCNTARDMVEALNLSKSNLSEAIDSLTKKGYLKGFQDEKDRRYVHLEIQKSANNIIKDTFKTHDDFINTVTKDIPEEKLDVAKDVIDQIIDNIIKASKNM